MLSGVESILSIFTMIFIGYYLARKGILNNEISGVFSRLVFDVSLPMLMVTSVYERFTREVIESSYVGISVAFISILTGYAAGKWIFKFTEKKSFTSSIYSIMFSFSNTIFIGLPVCISVLGEEAAPYALLYYFANTTLFWTLGIYNIKNEKKANGYEYDENRFKKIFSPPFAGFIAGMTLVFTETQLPGFILTTFKYMGSITTPLSMMIVGIMIYNIALSKKGRLGKKGAIVLLGKFIILPAITIGIIYIVKMPLLMKKAFILQSAMPVMAQSAIVARKYEIEQEKISYIMSASTLLSMAIIPVYVLIIQMI